MDVFLFLQNTVPMYFIKFRNKNSAHRFGTKLKLFGDANNNTQYRFKVLAPPNNILIDKIYNGFQIQEMPSAIYNEIIQEIENFNIKRHYKIRS